MATSRLTPEVLEGPSVRLEPMEDVHAADLFAVAQHPDLWHYMPFFVRSEDDFRAFIAGAAKHTAAGTGIGYVIRSKPSGEIVGATGFWNAAPDHRRLEIGFTWVTPKWQRTRVNTEAKYVLLCNAFEQLGCMRVEFKTDSLNDKSVKALERIGAKEEGVLRNHMLQPDGRIRHSRYFSIVQEEWPAVKAHLEKLMEPRPEI